MVCKIPINTTVAKRNSTPCSTTRATITTANAPVAPEIIPGLPPNTAVIRHTMMADKKNNLDTISLEKEIDKLVYELYGLTDDEIAIVENKIH